MSFRTQDDSALLLEFLLWYGDKSGPDDEYESDAAIVRRFLEQRQADAVSCYAVSQVGT